MDKKRMIATLVASVFITFLLSIIGNFVKLMNVRRDSIREFEIALKNSKERPRIGVLGEVPFPGTSYPTSPEITN